MNSLQWSLAAQALAELRDAPGSAVKQFFSAPSIPVPPGTPEQENPTMAQAIICN
ncbi:MAG TPA: hypothetical protein VF070_23920 [Streptosporangiaceae bacterium]